MNIRKAQPFPSVQKQLGFGRGDVRLARFLLTQITRLSMEKSKMSKSLCGEGMGEVLSVNVNRPDDPCQHLSREAAEQEVEEKARKVTFMFVALQTFFAHLDFLFDIGRPSCSLIRKKKFSFYRLAR